MTDLSHRVNGGLAQLVGEVVSLDKADAVLTLDGVSGSLRSVCVLGLTVTVPSISIARLTMS